MGEFLCHYASESALALVEAFDGWLHVFFKWLKANHLQLNNFTLVLC